MFDLRIEGAEKLMKALDKLVMTPDQLRKLLHNSARMIKKDAVANVSNRILHRRSGNLATNIKIDDSELDRLTVRVGVGKTAAYGAAHEFGAKTKPHDIYPRFKKVLAWKSVGGRFTKGGKIELFFGGKSKAAKTLGYTYARHVHHPGSVIPKRPWLMPAYESNKDKIVATFRAGLERSLTP